MSPDTEQTKEEEWEKVKEELWEMAVVGQTMTVTERADLIGRVYALITQARQEALREAIDRLWYALLFKSSCHQVKIEGASSIPCVCCISAVDKVGKEIDSLLNE